MDSQNRSLISLDKKRVRFSHCFVRFTTDAIAKTIFIQHLCINYYVHCNWGWGGYKDGYYNSKVFNVNSGAIIYDWSDNQSGGAPNYKYNLEYSIVKNEPLLITNYYEHHQLFEFYLL